MLVSLHMISPIFLWQWRFCRVPPEAKFASTVAFKENPRESCQNIQETTKNNNYNNALFGLCLRIIDASIKPLKTTFKSKFNTLPTSSGRWYFESGALAAGLPFSGLILMRKQVGPETGRSLKLKLWLFLISKFNATVQFILLNKIITMIIILIIRVCRIQWIIAELLFYIYNWFYKYISQSWSLRKPPGARRCTSWWEIEIS